MAGSTKEEQMNEPTKHCDNLSDTEKVKIQKIFIMSSLPPKLLLRALVAVVMRS
jgi:hypothetical protein